MTPRADIPLESYVASCIDSKAIILIHDDAEDRHFQPKQRSIS